MPNSQVDLVSGGGSGPQVLSPTGYVPAGPATSSGIGGEGGVGDYTSAANQNAATNAADVAAKWAYNNAKLQLVDQPMAQLQKEQLAQQAAQFARMAAMQDDRLQNIDKPMSDAQRSAIINSIATDNARLALQQMQASAGISFQGAQQADQAAQAQRQFAMGALQGSDATTLQREQMAAAAAGKLADTSLSADQLAASERGPRNAFQQMDVLEGLNAQGFANGAEALAGRLVLPRVQGDQAAPEAASLQTQADDMAAAGHGPTGRTYFDTLDEISRRTGDAAVSDNQRVLQDEAKRQLATQWSNPSQNIELGIAGANQPFTAPGNPQQTTQGAGDKVVQAWGVLQDNYRRGLQDHPPTDQQAIAMLSSAFDLTPAQAAELHMRNKDSFVNGFDAPTAKRMEAEALAIKSREGQGDVTAPVGAGARATTDYGNVLRSTGETHLSQDDPRLIGLIQQDYGVDEAQARQLAVQLADKYKFTGSPAGPAQSGVAATRYGGGGPYPGPQAAPPDPRGLGAQLRANYQAALGQYGVDYLSHDDPRMQAVYQNTTRLSPAGAAWMAKQADAYYKAYGQPISDADQEANLRIAQRSFGQERPTTTYTAPGQPQYPANPTWPGQSDPGADQGPGWAGAGQVGPGAAQNATPAPGFRAPIATLGPDIHDHLDREYQATNPVDNDAFSAMRY